MRSFSDKKEPISSAKGEDEYIENLNKVWRENSRLRAFRFFTDLANQWYIRVRSGELNTPVVLLGTGVPDELFRAAKVSPFRVLGGSCASCAWSDSLVPRDTDPASRSILGYLNWSEADFSDTLFVVPLNSDSMRKIAYLLKREGKKVCAVDIPPVKRDPLSIKKWRAQMLYLADTLACHVHRSITASSMKQAAAQAYFARRRMQDFLSVSAKCESVLSDSGRILVQNSYYWADDLDRWTIAVTQLTAEIQKAFQKSPLKAFHKPKVLLMGSPVYFPNFKIPFLMEDTGLSIWRNLDASTSVFRNVPKVSEGGNVKERIEAYADAWYYTDTSSAYMVNSDLRKEAAFLANYGQVDGVIYHVLKGQVEVDFELEYFEHMFEKAGIPVFRLETDYQYQDVEQLRIRLEAFMEMLSQKTYGKEIAA